MDTSSITLTDILFFIFASVSIASGIMVITRRNPVSSALYLALNFFSLAGIYLKFAKNNKSQKETKKLSTAQIFFIVFSVILVLSMVLSFFAQI